jgi:endonuclease/exonuclease/phosphatase family metal-dependent hydrolase
MDQQLDVHMRFSRLAVVAVLATAVWGCGSSRHETGQVTFKVLTINVSPDDSTDSRTVTRRIAEVIRDLKPDLVALQGIRRDVVQSDAFDVLTTLSDLTGMTYAFGETSANDTRRIGNGFLTRHPILEERNTLYSKKSGLLRLALDVGGSEVTVLTTLLDDGTDETGARLRRMIQELQAGAKVFLASSHVDANDEVITSLKEILKDAWERVGAGPGYTAPGHNPARRADYVLFSEGRPGFRSLSARLLDVPSLTHLPLWVEFEFVAN